MLDYSWRPSSLSLRSDLLHRIAYIVKDWGCVRSVAAWSVLWLDPYQWCLEQLPHCLVSMMARASWRVRVASRWLAIFFPLPNRCDLSFCLPFSLFLRAAVIHICSQWLPRLVLESEPASIRKRRGRNPETMPEASEIKALMMPLHNAGSAGWWWCGEGAKETGEK